VPDLTGYITEGQVVLSADVYARGVYPPVDPLSSLSRLMRHSAGAGRTRADHLDVAAQTLAGLARAASCVPNRGRAARRGARDPMVRF
jgi:V/A-type H+-transporting ATPase subunit B